ncbi:hypothetical protein QQF64_004866 [Cirrhinus molitorella]|uniref:Uncharacterized protein n=1 Tax=Cirrhinus molitorella TaxID=172907 RepID=A0ABR3MJM3_9TELE
MLMCMDMQSIGFGTDGLTAYSQTYTFSALKYTMKTSINFKKKISYNQIYLPVGSQTLESSSKRVYYEDLPVPWVLELELPPKLQYRALTTR